MKGNFKEFKLFCLLFVIVLFASLPAWAGVESYSIKSKLAETNIPFVKNQGQIKDASVTFYANTFAGTVFLTNKGEIVYSLQSKVGETKQSQKARFFADDQNDKKEKVSGWTLKEKILGSKVPIVHGVDKAETKVNYFIGNEKENWRSNIPSYNSVSLGEIYDGIELKLKAYGNNVEKLFIVNSGADVSKIAMSLEGAKSIKINESGELEMETGLGILKFTKPYAYQEIEGKKTEISAGFSIQNSEHSYGFEVAAYNKDYPLIIDPLLSSTFIGGSNDDIGYSIATDLQGNVYITGATLSADYPSGLGAYDITCGTDGNCNGSFYDVFVSKFNNTLTSLLASTYIGGSSHDEGFSIAIGPDPEAQYVYITGRTESPDYPTTQTAYDASYNGGRDVFVSKLDANLSTLLASTYIGGSIDVSEVHGSGDEGGHDIALDYGDTGYVVYITGWTDSLDYPTTLGAYDTTYNGGISDVFVSNLNADLSALLASTYIGGSDDEGGNSITLASAAGNGIFVTGQTNSSDYPTTPLAYDQTYNGGWDVLVSNLDINLSTLMSSTYIGGGNDDIGNSIAFRSSGMNIFVTGQTNSSNYPATIGAYDTTCGTDGNCNSGFNDVIVSKLNANLSTILSSTFLGGSKDDEAYFLLRDSWRRLIVRACGDDFYLTGRTNSSNYPTTPLSNTSPGTYDRTYNGGWDAIVSSLNDNLTTLLASTYIGGGSDEGGYSIATDSFNLFVTGETISPNYPVTLGVYDNACGTDGNCDSGFYDVFVSKFTCRCDLVVSGLTAPAAAGAGTNISVTDITKNIGYSSSGASTTSFYLSTNTVLDAGDILLGSRAVPALAAGVGNTGTILVGIPIGTAAGIYYLIAKADANNVISETNENNNTRYRIIRIGPDLVVSSLSAPTTAMVTASFSITDTTRNIGGGAAVASTTRFYLSTNTILDAGDILIGSRLVPELAAGARSAESTLVNIPAGTAPGIYYLIAKADDLNVIAETNENNNIRRYGAVLNVVNNNCGETSVAGSNAPDTRFIELGKTSGTFRFDYNTYTVKDRIIVTYEGSTLFDSGCVGEGRSVNLDYAGSGSMLQVEVIPRCAGGSNTIWKYVVHCP